MGLIFLSAMTTAIAQLCQEQGLDAREALGSSLLTIAVSTSVVGLLVVLTGKCSLSMSGKAPAPIPWKGWLAAVKPLMT